MIKFLSDDNLPALLQLAPQIKLVLMHYSLFCQIEAKGCEPTVEAISPLH